MTDRAQKVPVVILIGDFTSGVTSWAFRLQRQFENHQQFQMLLVNCASSTNSQGQFDHNATSRSEVEALLRSLGPSIVVPNFVFDAYGICVKLIREGISIRCIGFCRADSDEEYYNPLGFYEPLISKFAAVSPRCADELERRLPHRAKDIATMPTGVTVPHQLAREYQNAPIRMVYGGRIAQLQKRVMDFVPLVKFLLQFGVDFTFDIIGGGRETPLLKNAMAEVPHEGRVRIGTRVSPEEMDEVWGSHDLFIQVSDFEGTSNSMLESMAQGTIPVMTRTESGVDGIIEEGTNGFTVKIGDMKSMALQISRLAKLGLGELRVIGEAAWNKSQEYSIASYAEKFDRLLRAALDSPSPIWPEGRPNTPLFSFRGLSLAEELQGSEVLKNPAFSSWKDGIPEHWSSKKGVVSESVQDTGHAEFTVQFSPDPSGKNAFIQQHFGEGIGADAGMMQATLTAKCSEPGALGFNVYVKTSKEDKVLSLNHPGDGQWHSLTHRYNFSGATLTDDPRFFVVLRAVAKKPALLSGASVIVAKDAERKAKRYQHVEPTILEKSAIEKRLLILFSSPLRGGAEDYTLTIGKAAIAANWDLHAGFANREATQSLIEDYVEIGAHYHPIDIVDVGSRAGQASFRKRVTRTLRLLRKLKPDSVLLELCGIQYGFAPMLACAVAGVPVCVVYQMVRSGVTIETFGLLGRRFTRSRDQRFVAVSKGNLQILSDSFRMDPNKIDLIPNGASVSRFDYTDEERERARKELRARLGVGDDCKLLITVGRLSSQKGHDVLIPAIPHVVKQFDNVRFILAGEGPERERLRELVRVYGVGKHVVFLGRRDDIPELLNASDLFVHPTRFEGQPFSLLEAIAAKLPILSTRASGISEILTDREHGILSNVEDVRDLREALLYALANPKKMRQMAELAYRDRMEANSEELMSRKTLELLDSIRT